MRINKKLNESSERLSMAMLVSKQGWFDLDIPTGKIEVSPEYPPIIGYSYDEFDTNFQNWIKNIHPEDLKPLMQVFNLALQNNQIASMKYRRRTKSGDWIWLESTGKVTEYTEDGKPKRMIGTHMDINERTQVEETLQESEKKYRDLFNTIPNGFYRSTPEGYFVDANPAFINMLGYSSLEELQSVYMPTDIYSDESERNDIEKYNSEFINQMEVYKLKRKDGKIIWIEDHARYIKDENGKVIFHEGICKDITDRMRIEAKLLERTNILNELNATKDKFFSIIAHDLRGPFANFRVVTDLLTSSYDELEETEKKEFLELIKDSANNLYSLLENLLDWSRSQRGTMPFNPNEFDFSLIAKNTVNFLKLSADNKNIELINNITDDTYITADVNMITTVIRNLVSNAIKFTANGGQININSTITEKDSIFSVQDNGIGLSKETINKLFRIDTQVTTIGTNDEKGTGLGLILCKEFVEKHGGKIWVESEVGKGSTFYFSLPCLPVEELVNDGTLLL
jgi:PAS domain S-box-containing protein